MTVRLRLTIDGTMQEYSFDRSVISVGRGPSNDLVLRGVRAARRHGEFRLSDDGELSFEVDSCGQPATLLRDGSIVGDSDGESESSWRIERGDFLALGVGEARIEILAAIAPPRAAWRLAPIGAGSHDAAALALALDACARIASSDDPARVALDAIPELALLIDPDLSLVRVDASVFTASDEFYDESRGRAFDGVDASPVDDARDPLVAVAYDQAVALRAALESAPGALALGDSGRLVTSLLWSGPSAIGAMCIELASPAAPSSLGELVELAGRIVTQAASSRLGSRERQSLREENRYFRERERRHYLFKELICESDAMKRTYEQLNALVDADDPALILGEAGSGKELLARALHHLGPRREGVFISLKCGALADEVLGVELFGCIASELVGAVAPRKGVFELATDGTVYLEEIERLSPMLQGKLLRTLKEGEVRRIGDSVGRPVRARLVASTHVPVEELSRSGGLRHELVLMLRENALVVPALRQRREDLMPLARMFLSTYASRYGARARAFSPEVAQRLLAYDWPGNVRELQCFIETAVLRAPPEADVVQEDDLSL